MRCVDCQQEIDIGELCVKCRMERLRKQGLEDGRIKKRFRPASEDVKSSLPPQDRD